MEFNPDWESDCGTVKLWLGDALDKLRALPDEVVQCCVTSPPYYGLRDYGIDGQIGLEQTPSGYVSKLVDVFKEIRRVLKSDGTVWLNIGDTYAASGLGARSGKQPTNYGSCNGSHSSKPRKPPPGFKRKDLIGIPWRVAFALQSDGWYLRQDIIWHKTNPFPESVTDRCTKSHEYVFLLSKSERYYFNSASIREPDSGQDHRRKKLKDQNSLEPSGGLLRPHNGIRKSDGRNGLGRNRRSVWTIPTKPFQGAHFAVFPPQLITPCILAGTRAGDIVLDPFMGSGTTAIVSVGLKRKSWGIELNPNYLQEIAIKRITKELRVLQ